MRAIIPCKDRNQWLKMRQVYLGEVIYNASDMAAYVGDSPYKTAYEAWLEKTGQKAPEDLSENVNILRGVEREPFIRQQIIEQNESWARFTYKQFDIYLFVNKEKKYNLGATLDLEFEVKSEDNPYNLKVGEHGIYEIKSVKETPQTFTEDKWTTAPPVYYQEQQYAQLMATGYTINILVAEFEKELENGSLEHNLRTYPPIKVDPSHLFEDQNVKSLDERLTKFAECVRTKTMPDKNVQGTDMEITFKADVVDLGSFYSNYEEVKSAVEVAVAPFKDLPVTAETEKEAKAQRAKLNKIRKSIEDKRLEVCRKWDEPKEIFNSKCKEIVSVVDGAISQIDTKLNDIETARISKKRAQIQALSEGLVNSMFQEKDSILAYFQQCGGVVYDTKWENRTVAKSAIEKDIQAQILNFMADFESLANFRADSELYNAMLMAYKKSRSLSAALQVKSELESARQIAQRAQEEQARSESPRPQNTIKVEDIQPNTEQKYTIGFEIFHVTKDQLSELNNYLKSRGISFKRTTVVKEANNG